MIPTSSSSSLIDDDQSSPSRVWSYIPPKQLPPRSHVAIPLGTNRYKLYLIPDLHQYLVYYPNEVFLVGLLGTHPLFRSDSSSYQDLAFEFPESLRSFLSSAEVQANHTKSASAAAARPKKWAKVNSNVPDDAPLCTITCGGQTFPIQPCVRGRGLTVLEINPRLAEKPSLLLSIFDSSQEYPDFSGYLAIMTARVSDSVLSEKYATSPFHPLASDDVRKALFDFQSDPSLKRLRTE